MKQRKRIKPTNYETKFTIRIEKNILELFTKKAIEDGSDCSKLVRNWIYEYIGKEKIDR